MKIGSKPLAIKAIKIAPELKSVQSLMPISKDDKAKLFESIKKDGIRDALRGYYKGNQFYLLSGLNRMEIAKKLGIDLVPVEELEIKIKDREAYAIDENLARRQLTTKQKRALIDYMLNKNQKASSRAIAKKVGVDKNTVEARRRSTGEIHQLERVGTDGKTRRQPTRQSSVAKINKAIKQVYAESEKDKETEQRIRWLTIIIRDVIIKYGTGLTLDQLQGIFNKAINDTNKNKKRK